MWIQCQSHDRGVLTFIAGLIVTGPTPNHLETPVGVKACSARVAGAHFQENCLAIVSRDVVDHVFEHQAAITPALPVRMDTEIQKMRLSSRLVRY